MKTQRIFIASPGDVEAERRIAARLVRRLATDFAPYFNIELTSWEEEPLLASAAFKSQISPPEDSDIFVAIFWGRLGSPLDSKYQRDDGSYYASATEYEFEMAMASYLTAGKPRMLVYRKTAPFDVNTKEEKAQLASLDAFF